MSDDLFAMLAEAHRELIDSWPVPDDQLTDEERRSRDETFAQALRARFTEAIRSGEISEEPFMRLLYPDTARAAAIEILTEQGIIRIEDGQPVAAVEGVDADALVRLETARFMFSREAPGGDA